jgi:hypothetical protein
MSPRLRYSTDPLTILKLAREEGRNVDWVIKQLLAGASRNEQRPFLKKWASAFREVYGIADYKALVAEAKRCGFFTSSK